MGHYKLEHLEQRNGWFHARLNIPRDVQDTLKLRRGPPPYSDGYAVVRFRRALETRDRSEARIKAARWIAQWQSEIMDARDKPTAERVADYWAKVESLNAALEAAKASGAMAEDYTANVATLKQRRGKAVIAEDKTFSVPQTLAARIAEEIEDTRDADAAYNPAIAATPGKIDAHLDDYLATKEGRRGPEYIEQARSTIKAFAAEFPTIKAVTPKALQAWVNREAQRVTVATIKRGLSAIKVYWKYLASIDAVEEGNDPFARLTMPDEKTTKVEREEFEPAEVVKLLNAAIAKKDAQLANLIRLGMYTGARIEELCALRIESVAADQFEIIASKTNAGERDVPIHPKLKATFADLIGDRKDGYVIDGLTMNRNKRRSKAIGLKFSELKKAQGFGREKVFHSIRATVITMLERAGVPESTTQDIVGHERATLTGKTYSGKTTMQMRHDAIAKLVY